MSDQPIFFLDSGIGGLPYLDSARELLPGESFYYLADRMNFPYGEKSPDELVAVVKSAVKKIMARFSPKILVIACNTASVAALSIVRAMVSIPVVGVVPAIKPAAEQSKNKRIGILATKRTVDNEYTNGLITQFASDCHVICHGAGDIVDLVENKLESLSDSTAVDLIGNAVHRFQEAGIDSLVLGCTHFLYIENKLKDLLGDSIQLVDSRAGVSRQLKRVIEGAGIFRSSLPENRFMYTGCGDFIPHYRKLAQEYKLVFSGSVLP